MSEDKGSLVSGDNAGEGTREGDLSPLRHPLCSLAEERENALIKAFIDTYGKQAEELVKRTLYGQGLACGRRAVQKYNPQKRDLKTASELWALSRGEQVMEPLEAMEGKIVGRAGNKPCAHWPAWKNAGMPWALACELYSCWVRGFYHAINPRIRYTMLSWRPGGDRACQSMLELVDDGATAG